MPADFDPPTRFETERFVLSVPIDARRSSVARGRGLVRQTSWVPMVPLMGGPPHCPRVLTPPSGMFGRVGAVGDGSASPRRLQSWIALVLLSFCSMAFVELSRHGEDAVVERAMGRPVFLLGIWGIVLSAVLVLLVSPTSVWRLTSGDLGPRPLVLISAGWAAIVALVGLLGAYTETVTTDELVGSLIGWVLLEEFLFRGALFDLVDRVSSPRGWADAAVYVSAILFAVSHMQYHEFDVGESAVQIVYVIPTGLLFGFVRRRTGSVWPSVFLHALANLIANAL